MAKEMMAEAEQLDPGMQIAAMAKDQANNLVRNISAKTVVELTDMRDQIDMLMRALKQREEFIVGKIEEQAVLARDVITMKVIVQDNLSALIARIAPAPATITQRANGSGE